MSNNFAAKVSSAQKFLYLLTEFEGKRTEKKTKCKQSQQMTANITSKFLSANWMLGTQSEKGIKTSTT